MADLLTHVLTGYALATLLSIRYEWIAPRYATVAMAGAIVPDFSRLDLLLDADRIEATLGIPYDWWALHTLGGSLAVCAIAALLVAPAERRRVFALLVLGALSHHALDLLLLNPSSYSYAVAWPLTAYHPPSPDLYLSSDRWPLAVAAAIAAVVRIAKGRTRNTSTDADFP